MSGSYLLHGKEEFVKDAALKAVLSTVDDTAYDLNVQFFDDFNTSELIDNCEALPFFAEKRVIVCKCLPKSDSAKQLIAYLPSLPDTTLLIFFIRGKADEKLEIVKYFKKQEKTVIFDELSEKEAVQFVASSAKKLDATISPVAASRLVSLLGTDISALNNELAKLADYVGLGNEITPEAVSKIVTPNIEYRIFDMLDSFFAGKTTEGLRALTALVNDGESAIGIASFIEGRIKVMLSARKLIDSGLNRNKVVALLGGHPFAAQKAHDYAKQFSAKQLIQAVCDFADVPHLKISGTLDDKEALLFAILKNFTPAQRGSAP
ncbi:MAG: DNA polymerase III subunit delta [Clostridia bacterium]|nr:DNA polymerase III subunit delta [Clostridia bacterium]